jgi:protein involved in polysaccharide export with SLBB domain
MGTRTLVRSVISVVILSTIPILPVLIAVLGLSTSAAAQSSSGGWTVISGKNSRDLIRQTERRRAGTTSAGMTIPLEAVIDPATYALSPGDALALTIWGSVELFLDLTVTSDGNLLIPSVGVMNVDGLTLEEATDLVRQQCAAPYPHSEIWLSLVRPTVLRIPVTGLVQFPGAHQLVSSSRLLDLIEMAGGLRDGADRRAIALRHQDGTEEKCDLLSWEVDAVPGGNPVLRSGDRVHVLPAGRTYRVRGIPHRASRVTSGASGPLEPETRLIPFRTGDMLAFALRAAGWPGAFFCDEGVWLQRTKDVQQEEEERQERGKARDTPERRWITIDEAADFALRPGDVIEIPFCREWISVGGAVIRPGVYPYLPGQTVADYVYLAGGPNHRGSHSGWKMLDAAGKPRDAAPGDTVQAGAEICVKERRSHTLATVLAPIASAVALVVSIVALVR